MMKLAQKFTSPYPDGLTTDLVTQYLTGVGEFELLTAKDEVELAQLIERGVDAARRLEEGSSSRRELAELRQVVKRGEEARSRFLTANLRLVVTNARRYLAASGMDFLDLIQEGNLGLIRAVEKFDWRKGFKFSTYATWWIRQAITRAIAQQSRTVRVPVHLHEIIGAVRGTQTSLRALLEREPTPEEIAEETGIEVERVHAALLVRDAVSLDKPVGEDGAEVGDFVIDEDAAAPDRLAEESEVRNVVHTAVRSLPEREARIVALRYGLLDGRPRPLQEIADDLKLTPERIRQIEKIALVRLREATQRVDPTSS